MHLNDNYDLFCVLSQFLKLKIDLVDIVIRKNYEMIELRPCQQTDTTQRLRRMAHNASDVDQASLHAVGIACEFMLSRIDYKVRISDVEAQTGFSARWLQLAFKRFLSMSPMAWLKEQRLLLARWLLKQPTGNSVSDIALMSGLNHFGRFSASFKQRFGMLPGSAT